MPPRPAGLSPTAGTGGVSIASIGALPRMSQPEVSTLDSIALRAPEWTFEQDESAIIASGSKRHGLPVGVVAARTVHGNQIKRQSLVTTIITILAQGRLLQGSNCLGRGRNLDAQS